jgi:hypothetical protein
VPPFFLLPIPFRVRNRENTFQDPVVSEISRLPREEVGVVNEKKQGVIYTYNTHACTQQRGCVCLESNYFLCNIQVEADMKIKTKGEPSTK